MMDYNLEIKQGDIDVGIVDKDEKLLAAKRVKILGEKRFKFRWKVENEAVN